MRKTTRFNPSVSQAQPARAGAEYNAWLTSDPPCDSTPHDPKTMSWPGHDNAPHFEIGWLIDFSWLRPARHAAGNGSSARYAKLSLALLVLGLFAALVVFQPAIKASLSKTLDRMARSAETEGRIFPDAMLWVGDKVSRPAPEKTSSR